MIPGEWIVKAYSPVRRVSFDLDYYAFERDVERAIVASVSLAYSSGEYCRLGSTIAAMSSVLCDCGGGPGQNCFEQDEFSRQQAVDRICPFLSNHISVRAVLSFSLSLLPVLISPCSLLHVLRIIRSLRPRIVPFPFPRAQSQPFPIAPSCKSSSSPLPPLSKISGARL